MTNKKFCSFLQKHFTKIKLLDKTQNILKLRTITFEV